MRFTSRSVDKAYLQLVNIDPREEGKSRQEKVSALRYLLGASIVLKKTHQVSLDLSVGQTANRESFINAVGEIVEVCGTGKYTVDFHSKFADSPDYAVGSNFLTTRVSNSRNGQKVEYPGRPAPLLDIIDEKLSIRSNLKISLENDYNIAAIRAPLAIWLLRSEEIQPADESERDRLDELHWLIERSIKSKYDGNVAGIITPSRDEINSFLFEANLSLSDVLGKDPADQSIVIKSGLDVAIQNESSEISEIVERMLSDFTASGLKVKNNLISRFASSLLAKRFLILTGLSGSGKTKLAHAFATWFSETAEQYRLVAVGADWTTNENVVGYQDAINGGVYRKPSCGALDVILRAQQEVRTAEENGSTPRPYFLILDEMNLSHVERYFSDILSAIESGQEIALHSAAGDLQADDQDELLVPGSIRLPENLFIVGTVNIDETTYMFSPKVLDRANVVEFRASAEDITSFLNLPSRVDLVSLAAKGSAFGRAFVAVAGMEVQLAREDSENLKERLADLFAELAAIGAEFGFRTAYEITRFVHFHKMLSGEEWKFEHALDAQVLQKLMPKLHGSERKLGPVLEALDAFCARYGCEASRSKIKRMQDRLKADGFTSFAEA